MDVCSQASPHTTYPAATAEDLAQTVKEVEAAGGRIIATTTDVRDRDGLKAAIDDGVKELGRLDTAKHRHELEPRRLSVVGDHKVTAGRARQHLGIDRGDLQPSVCELRVAPHPCDRQAEQLQVFALQLNRRIEAVESLDR